MIKEAQRLLLSGAAGASAALAFAPFEFWGLIFISLAVLFELLRNTKPWASFRIGFAWGLGLYLAGVSWVYVSLNVYGGMPFWMGSIAVLGFCSLLALFVALPAGLAARLSHHSPEKPFQTSHLVLLTCLLLLFEWSRSWVLTGFPWLDLGYSQTPSWLFGLAPIGGVYLISFAVLGVSAAASVLVSKAAHRLARFRAAVLIVMVFVGSYLAGQLDWSKPLGDPVQVGVVQPNTLIETKWVSTTRDQVIAKLANASAEIAAQSSNSSVLLVWPETALALAYQQTNDDFWQALLPSNANLITGLIDAPDVQESYNAAVMVCGQQRTLYRKRHLVPFGEYLPLRFLFNWVLEYLQLPMSDFSAWQGEQPLSCGSNLRIGLSICYEDAFAGEHRIFNRDSTVLVNISEDAWFGDSLAPHQRLQMAQMRARELSRPMVRSANSGPSAFIDIAGRVVKQTEQFESATLSMVVQPQTGATPFARFGNWVVWLAVWLAVLCLTILTINSRRRSF